MKVHTTEFKEQIKTLGRELDSIISFNGAELGVEELNSVTPYYEGNLLKSVMKQLDIDSNIEIPIGTEINYKFGVKVGDNYEYLDLGNYIVNEVEKQENTNSYIIKCYDKMLYSMVDYEKMNISYPISIRNYINAICEYLRLNFKNKNEEFVNYNKNIPNELYFDEDDKSLGYTFRDVLDELAEVTASTICVNNDELEIRYINDTKDTIDEEFLKNVNVNFGEKYGPINSIVLSRSAGSDNVYLQDENSINENGLTEIKITDNQIMNFNDRSEYLTDILDKLNGIEFYLNDFTSTGIVYYELCDSYNVQIGDNVYNCIMLNDEIKVTQGLVEEIFTERLNTSETDYSKSDKTDRKINQTNLIVDKQRGIIQGIVEKTDNNSSRITELEIADGEFSVQVSNIEKGIIETNQNVSTLQASLDNVSADFEDFKDNEFINSIGNLQDQIDGAIQFWNGEEIPTINNYPANEWTTEEERNNHRADIYTVIEDVDGELKQGKAYRFDKVDNIWQWIELTDNELSAVQAIAQEALDKSNKNIGDIQELVKKTSELSVKDEEITASVEGINNKYEQDITLTKEANGNPVVVTDAGPYPLESLKIEGKSYQETSTQSANILDLTKLDYSNSNVTDLVINELKTNEIKFTIGPTTAWNRIRIPLTFNENGKYTYTFKASEDCGTNIDSYGRIYGYIGINEYLKGTNTINKKYENSTLGSTKDLYFKDFDVDTSLYDYSLWIYPTCATTTTETITFHWENLGILKGGETYNHNYVGFVPNSLSPEYPSEIKNVEGVTNYFDYSKGENGYVNDSGVVISRNTQYASDYIYCNTDETWVIGGNTSFNNIGVAYFDKDKKIILPRYDNANKKEITITIPNNVVYFRIWINIDNSITASGDILKNTYQAQIQKGKSLKYFVPYGRWLEVENVGKNLANYNDSVGKEYNFNIGDIEAGKDYSLYLNVDGIMDFNLRYGNGGNNIKTFYNVTGENVLNFTATERSILFLNSWSSSGKDFNNIPEIMLVEGTYTKDTIGEYEPYTENTALVDLNKENLFDKDNCPYIDAYISANKTIGKTPNVKTYYIPCEPNTTYVLSKIIGKYCRIGSTTTIPSYGSTASVVNVNDTSTKLTLTTGTNDKYLIFNVYDSTLDTLTEQEILDSIKIYEGIETDDYYRLASIGDIKDTFENGVLTQRIGKVVLDGSESWNRNSEATSTDFMYVYTSSYDALIENSNYGFCDKFQKYDEILKYNSSVNTPVFSLGGSSNRIRMYFPLSLASTLTDFQNYLKEQYDAGTPVIVYYILETPIEHTLNYEILELHEGYNNITTNDELEPNMEITYLTDSKLNAKYATKGELKVTADNITSEINSTLKNGYTTIEQTNKIEQKITDNENKILIEVDKKVTKENYNTDKENLQKDIDSKVAEEDFTGANILLAINGDESEAQINADKINLNGVVTANGNFIIREDGSMEAKAGTFGAWNIDNDGNIYADRKVGNKIYRTYIQQANTEDGGETWAFSTQVSEDDGQTFYYTSFITNDGELYTEKDIISTEGTVAGQHLTALDLTYNPEFIIPIYGETIQSGTVSLPTSQSTAVAAITIDPGKYLVVSQFQFSTNADGQRAVNVSTSSGATSIDITQRAPSGLQTRIRHVGYLTPTKQTTYYWNMYQTSGATLSGNVWIQLFRLQ